MRARKNEATLRILKFVAANKGAEAHEIAERLRATTPSTSAILLRLVSSSYKQLSREKVHAGWIVIDKEENAKRRRMVYVYSITDRGLGRLKILEKRESKSRK
jgi:DNA-binding MarR family transcriptional regulator